MKSLLILLVVVIISPVLLADNYVDSSKDCESTLTIDLEGHYILRTRGKSDLSTLRLAVKFEKEVDRAYRLWIWAPEVNSDAEDIE